MSGRTATLTWNAASNAVSYSIYRDGELVGNATGTTYTDANLSYGTYAYYVKSVDSNGAKSSPTSTVTASVQPLATNLTLTQNGNGALLNWIEPEWCTPKTDNEMLTYGDGSMDYMFGAGDGETYLYVGHKYPTSMLNTNKVLYKVSFYAAESGNFTLFVYTSTSGNSRPQTTLLEQAVNVPFGGWTDVEITNPIAIDEIMDLWAFIYDPEAKEYPFAIGAYEGDDNYGNYISYDPYNPTTGLGTQDGYVILIRTYITDSAFFYNLYDNTTTVASNLSGNTYTLNSIANNTAHQYTLKTVLGNGQTDASNMAGITVGTASLGTLVLAENDHMNIAENACLTVTGNVSNNIPANLVLENGAQLVNNTAGVQATVKRDVTAYTDDGGWYTIATPFTSYDPGTVLATDAYDLYAYDEDGDSEGKEWINYKAGTFNLTPGNGYLYAHNPGVNLSMTGTLNSGSYSQNVTLGYANQDASIKGFNLLGNPTPHDISFTKTSDVSDGYYYLVNGDAWTYTTATTVPAGRGFLVKANATGQSVVLNPQSKGDSGEKGQYIRLAIGDDNAYLKLDEGVSMPLLDLRGRHSGLYFTQDHKPYVMLVRDGADSVDLSYEPHNGTQTLTVTVSETLDSQLSILNYLHLIDNKTGADIDLLATPSYTFESKTGDYASRFRLVFSADDDNAEGDANFAYFNGSEWQVSNTGEATLQVVDVMGRIGKNETINGNANISLNEVSGVYMMRLINGNDVKVQKVIIK